MKISFKPKFDSKISTYDNRKKQTNTINYNVQNSSSSNLYSLPTESIKANFCPSFGRYRVVDRVLLQNKNTMFLEAANIAKETYGQTSIYKLPVKEQNPILLQAILKICNNAALASAGESSNILRQIGFWRISFSFNTIFNFLSINFTVITVSILQLIISPLPYY